MQVHGHDYAIRSADVASKTLVQIEKLSTCLSNMVNTSEESVNMVPTKNEATRANFDLLPCEMVRAIVSYCDTTDLINLSEVCRRFEDVVQIKSLWRKVSLTPGTYVKPGGLVDMLGPHIHHVAHLDLSKCRIELPICNSDDEVYFHVEKLTLDGTEFFHKHNVAKLGTFMPVSAEVGIAAVLRKFKARRVVLNGVTMATDALCRAFASDNRQLESVTMENFMMTRKVNVGDFFSHFDNLREFDLTNSMLLFDSAHLERLMCRVPRSLEKLLLNGVNLRENYLELFELIVTRATDLKFLGVSSRYLKEPEVLIKLARLKELKALLLR